MDVLNKEKQLLVEELVQTRAYLNSVRIKSKENRLGSLQYITTMFGFLEKTFDLFQNISPEKADVFDIFQGLLPKFIQVFEDIIVAESAKVIEIIDSFESLKAAELTDSIKVADSTEMAEKIKDLDQFMKQLTDKAAELSMPLNELPKVEKLSYTFDPEKIKFLQEQMREILRDKSVDGDMSDWLNQENIEE